MENKSEIWCQIEIYNEYLKKITGLLTQIHTVEKMEAKASMELSLLEGQPENNSKALYRSRLLSTASQCRERLGDMQEELALVQGLKEELERSIPLLHSSQE